MDKNDKELLFNLQVARITLEILHKRRIGLQARLEGLTAFITHEANKPNKQITEYFLGEMKDVLAKGKSLMTEYAEFSAWTEQNLPEEFHFKTPE